MGHGDDHGVATPKVIEALATGKDGAPLGPVTWVSAGGTHSAAVVKGGCVYTWGGSTYGQVGQSVADQGRGGDWRFVFFTSRRYVQGLRAPDSVRM